jgi:hypothetical protein
MKDETQRLYLIEACGGDSPWGYGGGGGGGRVAIFYNKTEPTDSLDASRRPYHDKLHLIVDVTGGKTQYCGTDGENGTIYVNWCHAGSFIDVTKGVCEPCKNGTFSTTKGVDECTPCLSGQYQDHEGETECKACSAGQYNDETGKALCKPCAAGTFQNETGSTSCIQCPIDTYQASINQVSCIPCGAGQFSELGAIACLDCPPGTYRENTTVPQSKSSCIKCPAGTHNPLYQSKSPEACVVCPMNSFAGEGSASCMACAFYQSSPLGADHCNFSLYFWIAIGSTGGLIVFLVILISMCYFCRRV